MLSGNVLLILCCIFYLAWWLIAFKPDGAVKGMKSGWLLIPAVILGVAALAQIIRGSAPIDGQTVLIARKYIALGGAAVYAVLLAATYLLLKRPVTTELFLIIMWVVLSLTEINTFYGTGSFSKSLCAVFIITLTVFAAASIVCYLLYYGLSEKTGYIVGTIPLILVILMMSSISVGALV